MKNNIFSDIKKKTKNTDTDSFIEEAKVDGKQSKLDKNERRGSFYIEKKTGRKIKLSGKIIQVPVNGYELKILEDGAKEMGLALGSYLRVIGIEHKKKSSK